MPAADVEHHAVLGEGAKDQEVADGAPVVDGLQAGRVGPAFPERGGRDLAGGSAASFVPHNRWLTWHR